MAILNKSLYIVIFFISILVGQNTKPTIAILDFEGQGVDASEVQTLSERMRTETGLYFCQLRGQNYTKTIKMLLLK